MTVLQTFRLDGRTALVTGGNRGLGQAFALALAEAGARVAFVSRDAERNEAAKAEAARQGHDMFAIAADITDDGEVTRAVDTAAEHLGKLDILINNAGACYHNPSWDVTDEQWDTVFNVNVRALWKCSMAAGRHMASTGGGVMINIGSLSAMRVNRPQWQPGYNASKAAVHQLTRSLAAEWAPLNIRVNALAPGYVETEMAPVNRPEFKQRWIDDVPQQRAAKPSEIAPTVVYMASEASAFMTGSVLVIDGGYTVF